MALVLFSVIGRLLFAKKKDLPWFGWMKILRSTHQLLRCLYNTSMSAGSMSSS